MFNTLCADSAGLSGTVCRQYPLRVFCRCHLGCSFFSSFFPFLSKLFLLVLGVMPSTSTAPTTLPPTIVSVDRLGPPLACLCPGGRLVSTNYPHPPCLLPPLGYHQGGHTRPYLHSPHITIELRGQRIDWAPLLIYSLRPYLRSPRTTMLRPPRRTPPHWDWVGLPCGSAHRHPPRIPFTVHLRVT